MEADPALTENALRVLRHRYLIKDEEGAVVETPAQMFRRVAKNMAESDRRYGGRDMEEDFYQAMSSLTFMPNSPTLMNAGTRLQQLAACFVIPVEDSIEGIFDAVKWAAVVHQSGGGTGFSFSRLRPSGDIVASTFGTSSGPISFMRVFDIATDAVKQGGRRRGASMGVLRVDHPDIISFIKAKLDKTSLANFNISVGVSDKFMEAVKRGERYDLINPHNGGVWGTADARQVFDELCHSAWSSGDPGLLFLDEMNRHNPTPFLGQFETTNPCGEVPLLPFEACNLGSVNLARLLSRDGDIDWERFDDAVYVAVRFLDDVIDASRYPLPQIDAVVKGNRKIGLGLMGFADILLRWGIRYGNRESLDVAKRIISRMKDLAEEASEELASERGDFPNIDGSQISGHRRNATVLSIAPTGTISIIAGCSSGIEPIFSFQLERHVMEGAELLERNDILANALDEAKVDKEMVFRQLRMGMRLSDLPGVPDHIREVFVTAHDVAPKDQVRVQAKFQDYVDNAVSKTINLRSTESVETIRDVYLEAYEMKCKGITVYRDGSKPGQVLTSAKIECSTCGNVGL
ncbi:MAG: ribonucleotide-diphosphate reductase subunit alpha [Methanomassiliicoccales archaeon PtaU1.Bin124]|nr:MAG: ribonucleotide-diphosphate reductase subunit alpha [Methanomassiliicoccales archaeon PtaU1.Bin124]